MRTTVNIDDTVLRISRSLAAQRGESLSKVISDLIREGLRNGSGYSLEDGFPVFAVEDSDQIITLEDVKKDEDEL
jgi:hypothetical protein